MPALLFHSSGLSPKKDGWQEAAGITNGASLPMRRSDRLLTDTINTWKPRCVAAQIPIRRWYHDSDYLHCLSKVIICDHHQYYELVLSLVLAICTIATGIEMTCAIFLHCFAWAVKIQETAAKYNQVSVLESKASLLVTLMRLLNFSAPHAHFLPQIKGFCRTLGLSDEFLGEQKLWSPH